MEIMTGCGNGVTTTTTTTTIIIIVSVMPITNISSG
jgi:hypothetical protein